MNNDPISYGAFVRLVLDALEDAGIDYLIGGAVAAWAWGEPRSTLDLDLVVNIPVESVSELSKELEMRDMLVSTEIILDALIEEQADVPINAIHMYSGFKADLYILHAHDELRQSAFRRRALVDFGPPIGRVYVHAPEDLIIYKTWYFSLSRQTKHLRDIAAIAASLGDKLDYAYIETWITRRGLTAIWQEILAAIRSD
jgi:hypothetical protein